MHIFTKVSILEGVTNLNNNLTILLLRNYIKTTYIYKDFKLKFDLQIWI